jgi:serine/threonine-protein kinase HipA
MSIWPYIGDGARQFRWRSAGLAMALRARNVHYALHTLQARHWHALAMKNGGPRVWQAMLGLVDQVESALATVESRLPPSFPGQTWDAVRTGMRVTGASVRMGSKRAGTLAIRHQLEDDYH